jgi:hypothetical protein
VSRCDQNGWGGVVKFDKPTDRIIYPAANAMVQALVAADTPLPPRGPNDIHDEREGKL